MAKHQHLSLEDRITISSMLNDRASFQGIGASIDKHPSTVSKEVRRHIITVRKGCSGHAYNNCLHRKACRLIRVCGDDCIFRRRSSRCWSCSLCNEHCSRYEPDHCARLDRPPYVCNGCPDKHHSCTLEKRLYSAREAQKSYEAVLSGSRTGICLSEEEIARLDSIISPLILKGQSVHAIYARKKDSLMISESTIYRLIDAGLLTARNMDLPRKVRFSRRKRKKDFKVDRSCRIGRTHADFLSFIEENPDLPLTEMDSVEGRKGGKVLLTIHFVKAEFMLAFIRGSNDSKSVIDVFERLYQALGHDLFGEIMPILLGDNGSEFSNPGAIEFYQKTERRCRVFYCNPSAPYQKGSAERNHEFIRMFIPKGRSMDEYTQEHIDLMMDHINSYSRPSLGDKCPYQMMEFLYGRNVLDLFGSSRIPSDDVTLNASVFEEV